MPFPMEVPHPGVSEIRHHASEPPYSTPHSRTAASEYPSFVRFPQSRAVSMQGCGQECRHGSTWKWEVSGVIDGPLHIVA